MLDLSNSWNLVSSAISSPPLPTNPQKVRWGSVARSHVHGLGSPEGTSEDPTMQARVGPFAPGANKPAACKSL